MRENKKREKKIIEYKKNIDDLKLQLKQQERLYQITQNYCYLSDASLKRAYYELF